jgi:hypothetical protein
MRELVEQNRFKGHTLGLVHEFVDRRTNLPTNSHDWDSDSR